jgi:hypothetical protein
MLVPRNAVLPAVSGAMPRPVQGGGAAHCADRRTSRYDLDCRDQR